MCTTAQGADMITSGRNNKLTYILLSDVDKDSIVHEDRDRSGYMVGCTVYGIERPGGGADRKGPKGRFLIC